MKLGCNPVREDGTQLQCLARMKKACLPIASIYSVFKSPAAQILLLQDYHLGEYIQRLMAVHFLDRA